MKRFWYIGFLWFLFFLTPHACLASQAEGLGSPTTIVRALENLQDHVAHGERGGAKRLKTAFAQADKAFLSLDSKMWRQPAQLYALLTYLFIGGNRQTVEHILQKCDSSSAQGPLIEAALFYLRHGSHRYQKFLPILHRQQYELPSDLLAALSLNAASEGVFLWGRNLVETLDVIRALAPGTLFEEVAIRREIGLMQLPEDLKKIKVLVYDYKARFENCIYRRAFWQSFGDLVDGSSWSFSQEELNSLIKDAPQPVQCHIYKQVVRNLLLQGSLKDAIVYAGKAAAIGNRCGEDTMSLKLYKAIAEIPSTDTQAAFDSLKSIDPRRLSKRDVTLWAIGYKLASEILNPLQEGQAQTQNPAQLSNPQLSIATWLDRLAAPCDGSVTENTQGQKNYAFILQKVIENLRKDNLSFANSIANAREKMADVDKILRGKNGHSN